jgi:hypothetical protein
MTGLAGQTSGMGIEPDIVMGLIDMAIGAFEKIFAVHTHGHRASPNAVLFSMMAIDTLHIEFAHMNVDTRTGEKQGFIHIAVLDRIATTALEVAGAAVTAAWQANAAGRFQQVDGFIR